MFCVPRLSRFRGQKSSCTLILNSRALTMLCGTCQVAKLLFWVRTVLVLSALAMSKFSAGAQPAEPQQLAEPQDRAR